MFKRVKIPFFALLLTSMSLCGFMCYVPDDVSPVAISEEDCLDYFRYKARINLADTVKGYVFYKNELIYSKNYCYSCEEVKLALQTYCGDCSELNLADLEAELNENAGENSEYWFDAPVFY